MAINTLDRVYFATTTTGTGTVADGTAESKYRNMASAETAGDLTDGDCLMYVIEDGTDWEIGTGIFSTTGPVITRDVVYRTSAGGTTKLTLSGSAKMFISEIAQFTGIADTTEIHVYNNSGSSLTKGHPVYISGFNVGEALAEVSLADADDSAKMPAIGVVSADIANTTSGFVTTFGSLTDLDTSAWSQTDSLYVSTTAGALTNTRPTGATASVQKMGIVLRDHNNKGIIEILGAGRSNDIPNKQLTTIFRIADNTDTTKLIDFDASTITTATTRTVTMPDADVDLTEVNLEEIQIACSTETGDLVAGTAKATFRMPYAMTLTDVRASVNVAPTGSALTVDINDSGSTIMTTNKLTIDATEKTSETAATAPGITDSALADDAEITIDIDSVGSTLTGEGLKVTLIGVRA